MQTGFHRHVHGKIFRHSFVKPQVFGEFRFVVVVMLYFVRMQPQWHECMEEFMAGNPINVLTDGWDIQRHIQQDQSRIGMLQAIADQMRFVGSQAVIDQKGIAVHRKLVIEVFRLVDQQRTNVFSNVF
ncbi:hypothetical protein D3C86_1472940 [compost metagenome]